MPIEYTIHNDGHFIHAIASSTVTDKDLVDYEVDHNKDERIKIPVDELFEVHLGAFQNVTRDGVSKLMEHKKESREPIPHRCAIVVSYSDNIAWDLAKFYEKMAIAHSPKSVIVFGDIGIAKKWLGAESPKKPENSNTK
ncbi:MAG: hypothetical protein PVH77_08645 [Phycisphaerales bacterium]|jgi:hypothetical protein